MPFTEITNLLQDLKAKLEGLAPQEQDYAYQEIDLSDMRADAPLGLMGTSLSVKRLTGEASLKFNSTSGDAIPLGEKEVYQLRFSEVYLSNAAQPGLVLAIFVGRVP